MPKTSTSKIQSSSKTKNNSSILSTKAESQIRKSNSKKFIQFKKRLRPKSSYKNTSSPNSLKKDRSRSKNQKKSKSKSKQKISKSPNIPKTSKKIISQISKKTKLSKVKNDENFISKINYTKNHPKKFEEEKKIEDEEFSYSGDEYINKEEDSISEFSEVGTDYLPCRKNEQDAIYNYITKGLQTNGNYNSLYIAGMPGTGKTASVRTIINILEAEIDKSRKTRNTNKEFLQNRIVPFKKLFISGMEYSNIINVFKTIYNFIFAKKQKQFDLTKYIQLLDDFFKERQKYDYSNYLNDPTNSHLILVIDEIDILINKTQNLLYNIFNWTTYDYSKLIVISISNTLDLPNRLLPKIHSRMGNNKIMFKPYTYEELLIIVKSKGIDIENFSNDALRICCMKVAAINGDIRRVFQILSKAKEIADFELKKKKNNNKVSVDKNHIIKAWNELFSSKILKVIKSLQVSEKIILASVFSKIKDNCDKKIKLGDLYDKKNVFINKYNEEANNNDKVSINWEEFQKIIYNLLRIRLLSCTDMFQKNFVENYVIIKFYTDEFILACVEDEEDENFKKVMDYLKEIVQ